MAAQIPSSISHADSCQFAISSIALHHASALPAFSIAVLNDSAFIVRSHTQAHLEYVQDTPQPPQAASTSTSTSEAEHTEAPTAALVLKVHAGDGFQLSFELKGQLLDSAAPSSPSVATTTRAASESLDNNEEHANEDNSTAAKEGSVATAAPHSVAPVENDVENSLATNSPSTPSGSSPLMSIADTTRGTSTSVYFAEATSELELLELCRTAEFEQQVKQHQVSVVEAQPLSSEISADGQGLVGKRYTWTWNYPLRDHVEDDCLGRKTVFAFLHRNPTSSTVHILSQFSLWIVGKSAYPTQTEAYFDVNADGSLALTEHLFLQPYADSHAPGLERVSGSRHSAPQGSSSAPTTNSRHWRRASTPERFTSTLNRHQSFHAKGFSIPSTQNSFSSLPDAVTGLTGAGTGSDLAGNLVGSSVNLNPATFAHDTEDGPLFRATVVECENHIRDMKASTKRIIKAAQTVMESRKSLVLADETFVKELEGFKPAEPLLNNYLRPMSQSMGETSEMLAYQMRNLLIEPLNRFYANDIKAAEVHRKTFDDESKDYYQFLSRYMAMKQDSNRKKSEADAKYERKRRHFELKRFEYWSFLLDMRVGGSKSDEILHHLTNYAEKHCRNMTEMALLADDLKPGLDMIAADLLESHKRATMVRKERQERRRELLESQDENLSSIPHAPSLLKSGSYSLTAAPTASPPSSSLDAPSEVEGNLDISNTPQEASDDLQDVAGIAGQRFLTGSSPVSSAVFNSAQLGNTSTPKFSGIRDLEHQDIDASSALGRRKEGFLFATSRPSMHNNSAVLEKPSINWHKYWCVVSEGHLHEYSHWKKGATMLHNEPINLKISTVRPCRNQDRRFCFEVITPKYRRVYQATSAEDMNSWVSVISNAIQSLLNGNSSCQYLDVYGSSPKNGSGVSGGEGIATGRSSMEQGSHERQINDGSNDFSGEVSEVDHLGTRLLKMMREARPSNNFCAECGAKNPDWCAINLGILICIECSGIHRSLGTHISKVRSFTLDTTSYTRDLFDFIRSVGNEVSNQIWEANLVQSALEIPEGSQSSKVVFRRPLVNDARDYKVTFIQKKYVEKAFVNKQRYAETISTIEEQAMASTKALFQAVINNSIPEVIAAFAAGADLNAIQEAEVENEEITPGSGHTAMGSEGTTGSSILSETQMQASLEGLSLSSEGSSRLSRSTIASSILNMPGSSTTGLGHESQHDQLDVTSPTHAERYGSPFMVMQTSPLLLALRHGLPFSLDEQYEVYPMAEFMLQNGAASNLSVEVRLIDDEEGSGQGIQSESAESTSTSHHTTLLLSTDASNSNSNTGDSEAGWDSAHVDPEDIKALQQRSNRRSLGQVVHMRGEGGATAMEYLRAKSAARGEHMPGSPPANTATSSSYPEAGSLAAAAAASGSCSPPSTALSPRLRPQNNSTSGLAGSVSAPTSVLSSPNASGGHGYSTTVLRNPPTSMHQDISTLFQKRRESDGGLGPALFAAGKATEDKVRSGGSGGAYKLQNAATVPSSPAMNPHHSHHQHQSSESSSSSSTTPILGHSTMLQHSSSRAHKVKATLSKSLRLSAAYIKNNMMKEDASSSKEYPVPAITQTMASPPSATMPAAPPNSRQSDGTSSVVIETQDIALADSPSTPTNTNTADEPLSGPYIMLHKKGTISPST